MLKQHTSFFALSSAAVSLNARSALIGQLTHAWASTPHHVSTRLCRILNFSFTSNTAVNYADGWPGDSVALGIAGCTAGEAFKEQRFL